jgi:hypothetical protein
MSDLLAPVLAEIQNESDAFWCFVGLMQKAIFVCTPTDNDMDRNLVRILFSDINFLPPYTVVTGGVCGVFTSHYCSSISVTSLLLIWLIVGTVSGIWYHVHVAELSEGTYTSYGTPLLFPPCEACRCHGTSLLPPLDFTVSHKDATIFHHIMLMKIRELVQKMPTRVNRVNM